MLNQALANPAADEKVDVGSRLATQKGILHFPSKDIELFILPGFLSPPECNRLMEVMDGEWKPSKIADDIGVANYRTSETCQMDSTHPVVADLEERLLDLTGLNPLHGEPLQGQRYQVGQEFKEHTDYFEPDGPDYERYCSQTGQRTWTAMIYLNEPEAGGLTYFKRIGAAVKPMIGTLVAWNNQTPDGRPNENTLHHGMPVEKGTKYILTKWFRERAWAWPEEIASRLAQGLRFDGAPRTQHVRSTTIAASSESRPGAAQVDEGVALKRRDWILSVMQELRELRDLPGQIARARNISSAEFLREYYAAGRPVLLDGELDEWPALRLWNPEYLKRKIGAVPVEFQGSRSANSDFELQKDVHKRSLPFEAYIDLIEKNPGNDAYITANNSRVNQAAFECLADDVRPLAKFLRGGPGMIWVGPIGTFTPLHHDLTNNLLAQVVGSKRVILVPPSDTRFLYNHRHVFSAVHDIMDEERLEQFPLASQATTYEVDLEAGQILFIPIGWWHQVTALDFSVTFTLTDFLWKNQFHDSFPPD